MVVYVRPALVEIPQQSNVVRRDTFAPILYMMPTASWTTRSRRTIWCRRAGQRLVEGLHAAHDDDDQLFARTALGAGHQIRQSTPRRDGVL